MNLSAFSRQGTDIALVLILLDIPLSAARNESIALLPFSLLRYGALRREQAVICYKKRVMSQIPENLFSVRQQIRNYENGYQRSGNPVTLLAVSKTKPVADILAAYEAGQRDFGENYLDEALTKIQQIDRTDCVWHFIGAIQSNKTRPIAEHFDWVHTLDRLKIAKRLSTQRPRHLPPLNCCVQLNIDNEASKSGIAVNDLSDFLQELESLPQLNIRGLMVIPALRKELEQQRAVFQKTRTLLETQAKRFPSLDTLSMGMSGDMEAAIAEGSTIVRIGTAIFGQRQPLQQ